MSQGTFSDTLIRLEAFKTIFVFRSKIYLGVRFPSQWLQNFWSIKLGRNWKRNLINLNFVYSCKKLQGVQTIQYIYFVL